MGDDDGCFENALDAVRRWGGVLEHPKDSRAWAIFGLPVPPKNGGWVRGLFCRGWSCCVDQQHYGHEASKPTWLYYCGPKPPALIWGCPPVGLGKRGRLENLSKRKRAWVCPDGSARYECPECGARWECEERYESYYLPCPICRAEDRKAGLGRERG